MKKFNNYSSLFVDENNRVFSGIAYVPDFSLYGSMFKSHTITATEEYRPDKIAFALWGNADVSWVLDEINEFTNGISSYTHNTVIKYLEKQELIKMGLL